MGPDRTEGCAPPLPEYSQAGSLPHLCPRPEGMRFVPHTSLPVLQPLSPNIPPAQGAHLAWRRGSSRAGYVVQLHQHSWGHTKSWVTVGSWLKPESKSWGLIIALGAGRAWGEGKHQAQGHPALPGRHSSADVQHAQPHRAAVRPGHPRAKFTPQSPIRN